MSSHYNTEPPPTASATLNTTAGPLHISLFAKQTPLACKNFLQHCLDGYYNGTSFHRVIPDFIIQGGDPTGTGAGGSSIYEDPEFEFDSRDGEKVVFKDEIHSRLRFTRRGLVGMAKAEDGTYGSQFFVTLGSGADRQLTGTCTMFGRIEGDSIYNVVKIAEGDLVEGTERPVYAVKVTGCEVGDLGPFKDVLKKREKVAVAAPERQEEGKRDVTKKRKKVKGAKVLLSFADDEEEDMIDATQETKKPKFNTRLVTAEGTVPEKKENGHENKQQPKAARTSPALKSQIDIDVQQPHSKRRRSVSPSKSPPLSRRLSRDPNTQLPLPDPEVPSRSPSSSPTPPTKQSALSRTTAEIDALKASMRRNVSTAAEPAPKKSALESLIPETSIRGRRRPGPGNANGTGFGTGTSQDSDAMKMFNAFKARLEQAESISSRSKNTDKADDDQDANSSRAKDQRNNERQSAKAGEEEEEEEEQEEEEQEEEEQLCDLHFIANCQSCRAWDTSAIAAQPDTDATTAQNQGRDGTDDNPIDWMTHKLTFGKDKLGKDLNWKRTHEDADGLVVIDPREKEKEVVGSGSGSGRRRERERQRKIGTGHQREWDRKGR
ncbi:hypothetical protein EMCG_08742 [[Emmonsia] crescens]|uniref:PPIase cyclophilin-type domain-containing protein n=1 Tax=[Emmonsia] crescens TaxID=73230 RepID=A0A0G2I4Q3_9EURO|nr:hypothetical protein EMCG_08742 [Emmonsia crescens UAMH 3008]